MTDRELVTGLVPVSAVLVAVPALDSQVLALVDQLRENGGDTRPILVENIGGGVYRLLEGSHRLSAYKLLERRNIPATYNADPKGGEWWK